MEKSYLRNQKLYEKFLKKELASNTGTKKIAETKNIYLKKLIKNSKKL